MSIQANIRPFSHPQTDRLYDAMMHYLKACQRALEPSIKHTQKRKAEIEQSIVEYREQYRKTNPHLVGSGEYSHVRLPMKAA